MSRKTTKQYSHKTSSREENDALYPRVVAGDESAIQEMILGNMALVAYKVSIYLEQFPHCAHLKEDLLSQGYLGLVTAVRGMVGVQYETPNPTGLMSQSIHYRLGELLDFESAIRIPQRTWIRKRNSGKTIKVPVKESSITGDHVLERDGCQDPRTMVDLIDELYGCCETDEEKEIIRLRMEGRGDDEVSTILGLPKTTTYMLRKGIYDRYLRRNPEMEREDD